MKKVLFAIVAIIVGFGARAEGFIGGTIGLDVTHVSVDHGGSATQTVFGITPEIGYNFNKTWAVGVQMGYGITSTSGDDVSVFKIQPFVRGTFASAGKVDFFGELAAGYARQSAGGHGVSGFQMALRPGMAINFTSTFALIARTELLQFEHWDNVNVFEFGLNKGFEVGVAFKF